MFPSFTFLHGSGISRPLPLSSSLTAVSSVPLGESRCIIIQVVTRRVKTQIFSTISRSCLSASKKLNGKILVNHTSTARYPPQCPERGNRLYFSQCHPPAYSRQTQFCARIIKTI